MSRRFISVTPLIPTSIRQLLALAVIVALGVTANAGGRRHVDPPSSAYASVGARAERGYFSQSPWDTVDVVNGDLTLHFTDAVLPGNAGMDLKIKRVYNDQRREWFFMFVDVPMYIRDYTQPSGGPWDPTLVMGDYSEKPLHSNVLSGYRVTSDFWRYDASSHTLALPNGWVATYEATDILGTWGRLVEVHDLYSNSITPHYSTTTGYGQRVVSIDQSVSDHSRTLSLTYASNSSLPASITDGDRTWSYTYGYSSTNGALLTEFAPPAGPNWSYSYSLSSSGGTITVETPNGGTVIYTVETRDWTGDRSMVTAIQTGGRDIASGTWSFDYSRYDQGVTSTVGLPSGRNLVFVHQFHDNGPDGVEWTLESRTLLNGSTTLSSLSRSYDTVAFAYAKPLRFVRQQTIGQDGLTFTTDYDYSSSNFADYLQPNTITEKASNHSVSRVTSRTFTGFSSNYILPKVASSTVTVGSESFETDFSYDSSTGFMTSQTAFGLMTSFSPDSHGNVGVVTDAHSHSNSTDYEWGVPQAIHTPEYTISRSINADGTVASETRNGHTTDYSYDGLGRVTGVTPPEGAGISTSYASDGTTVTVSRSVSSLTTTLDGFGRPIGTENADGVRTITSYDSEGRKTFQSAPFTGSSATGNSFDYDGVNRVTTITHADTHTTVYGYSGTDVSITDEKGNTTTQHWQIFGSPGNGRLTGVTDAASHAWTYSYNAAGSLTQVAQPDGHTRTWNYNGNNQLTSEVQPESGTTSYTYDGGLLSTKTDAQDQTTTYHYDNNHRLTEIVAPTPADSLTFTYDAADNRTRMTGPATDTIFSYDYGNRLLTREDQIGGHSLVTSYAYDTRDNLTSITYPSGRVIQYDYDYSNHVHKVYSGSTVYADNVTYHAGGALSAASFGNGTSESLSLTDRFRPYHLTSGPLDLTYSYEYNGNVSGISDTRSGGAYSSTFEYDNLDRLTNVSGFGATSFTYDSLGNRLTKGSGSSQVTYSYSSTTSRLSSASSTLGRPETGAFEYYDTGNLKNDGPSSDPDRYTFDYSFRNQMVASTFHGVTTSYTYDPDGLRVSKTTGSATKYYVHGPGGLLLAEYDATVGAPAVAREYIYLGSKLLASFAPEPNPTSVARVTGVTTSVASVVVGNSVNVTVSGLSVPCHQVKINYGDGTTTSYPLSSPYSLPMTQSHTYSAVGLYTIVAEGETVSGYACTGKVSASLEVRTANVVTNGDFSGGSGGTGPTGWSLFSSGTAMEWSVDNGFFFFRPSGSNQAVIEQGTGLSIPAGAPLEATFTLGNTDTVTKRVSVIIRSSGWDDLAICNFYLPASQMPASYTMRTHTTVSWSNATIDVYAADVNQGSSTGAYQLDDVVLTYRPAGQAAATECVDPNAPTSGGSTSSNLIANGNFGSSTDSWTLYGSMESRITSQVLEYYKTTGSTAPYIAQGIGSVSANQRLAAVFDMANTSSTRQRVTVSLQAADASTFISCVFYLAAGTPRRAYAITSSAPASWSTGAFAIVPNNGGSESSYGWLQLDNVSVSKITTSIIGTGCYEPGSFVVDEEGTPAPLPTPMPAAEAPVPNATSLAAPPGVSTELNVLPSITTAEAPDVSAIAPVPAPAVTWVASVVGSGSGTISSSPAGVSCSGYEVSCAGWFSEGSTVTFTATATTGHTFAGWGGACSGATGTSCQVFIARAQTVVATFNGPSTINYYHTDALGSVRAVTDASGAPLTRLDYFPFGESSASLAGDPRKYVGSERDVETVFDYMGARYYRNVWGRFTGVDSVFSSGAIVNPQLWNRYAYGLNSPLRFSDPTGMEPEDNDDGNGSRTELPDIAGDRIDPDSLAQQLAFSELFNVDPQTPQTTIAPAQTPMFDAGLKIASDFSAGLGAGVTFGATDSIRAKLSPGTDAIVNRLSTAYQVGNFIGGGVTTTLIASSGLSLAARVGGKYGMTFGRGGLLNTGNRLRFGWGWNEYAGPRGNDVIRFAFGPKDSWYHVHLDLWQVGRSWSNLLSLIWP